MSITVRRIQPSDAALLRQLRIDALTDSPDAFGATLAQTEAMSDEDWRVRAEWAAEGSQSVYFFAETADGAVVGLVGGYRPADEPELVSMWTAPAARGQGVAGALVDAVIDWAHATGASTLGLWVTRGNAAAEGLYRTRGFVADGTFQPAANDPCRTEQRMVLTVAWPSEDRAALAVVTTAFAAACAEVTNEVLERPTPCTQWDVRALIDHVTGGNRFTVELLAGASAEDAMAAVMASFGPDHDPVAAALDSLTAQAEAIERAQAARVVHHVVGDITAASMLRLRIHDLTFHTWDLSQAVDGAPMPQALVEHQIAELAATDSLVAGAAGVGAAPVDAEGLLARFGRTSSWRRT